MLTVEPPVQPPPELPELAINVPMEASKNTSAMAPLPGVNVKCPCMTRNESLTAPGDFGAVYRGRA